MGRWFPFLGSQVRVVMWGGRGAGVDVFSVVWLECWYVTG